MARQYADEFPHIVVRLLRDLGHDVLTVQEAGKANQKIPDEEVLAFAIRDNRADLIRLHRSHPNHFGVIVCTEDLNRQRLTQRIHEAILMAQVLTNKLIRVNRPH